MVILYSHQIQICFNLLFKPYVFHALGKTPDRQKNIQTFKTQHSVKKKVKCALVWENKSTNYVFWESVFICMMTSDGFILDPKVFFIQWKVCPLVFTRSQRLWVGFPGLYYTQYDSQKPEPQHISSKNQVLIKGNRFAI